MTEESSGEGWVVFAGIVLGIAGIMRFFDAIWAWSYHGALPSNLQAAIFGHSLNTYGWVWLGVAIVLVVTGLAVQTRSQVARWTGVVAGSIGAITAIWWMPYYPVWSFVYVVLGVMVVYALAAHGQKEPEGWVTEQAAASQARPAASSSM
ncbi:MAG TPA: hypothetical protein VMF65_04915 [Acidimicrobiales bacterium]|nr:hypothetical protein [Acidimicrobiales bacterium]